ncbi:MAG: hypothetical protein ABII27_05300 [bacterium]
MTNTKIAFLSIFVFTVFMFGLIPSRRLSMYFFNESSFTKKSVEEKTSYKRGTNDSSKDKKVKQKAKREIRESIQEKKLISVSNNGIIQEEILEAKIPPQYLEAKLKPPKQKPVKIYEVELFDPMESIELWTLEYENGLNSNIGLHKGIDRKAVALFYNLEDNGSASLYKKGSWNLNYFKGVRFACKIDGPAGNLILTLERRNKILLKKVWNEDLLEGSVWKIYMMQFDELMPNKADGSLFEENIDKIQFKLMAADKGIKGRIIIDNVELLK